MKIENFIFRRYAHKNKYEFIKQLTNQECLSIQSSTIIRILQEISPNKERNYKEVRMNVCGNNWNSTIESISYKSIKGSKTIMVNFYLQYSNTDTNVWDSWYRFTKDLEYRGSYEWEDIHGGKQTTYFTYDSSDKVRFIKNLLIMYLNSKYEQSYEYC